MADPVSLAITAALTAAQMALTMSQKIEGPRLDDVNVTVADYGTALNYFYGTRRFEGVPIIWAEPLKEVKRKRKTKGGKYNEYTYYGTWAVAVADQEIDAVTRIWFDKHLIYDVTGPGPITAFGNEVGFSLERNLRIYLGTEDQEADERMVTTVEAEHGAGSCPAYRGVAYIVFEEIPLEKLGNRIPQITVEAVCNKSPAYPYEAFPVATQQADELEGFTYSPDHSRITWGESGNVEVWDVASRTLIASGSFSETIYANQAVYGISNQGTVYAVGPNGGSFPADSSIFSFSGDGGFTGASIADLAIRGDFCQVLADAEGREFVCIVPYSNLTSIQYMALQGLAEPIEIDVDWIPSQYLSDTEGNIWALGATYGDPTPTQDLYFRCIIGARANEEHIVDMGIDSAGIPDVAAVHNSEGQFAVYWEGTLFLINDETFAIDASRAISLSTQNTNKQFINSRPGSSRIWVDDAIGSFIELDLTDLTTIRTLAFSLWNATDADGVIYDPINHALITFSQVDPEIQWRYLDRITDGPVTLRSIVEDVCTRCGIESGDVDATDLTQEVAGYSWTQGSGKDIISPLLDLYDSDARPHNFQIEFLQRGASAAGTIAVADLVAESPRYAVTIAQDTDLPRSITLSFADPAGDQQTNTVRVQRPLDSVDGIRELSIDMTTWVGTVDEARQLAERYFRRVWNGRESFALSLTPQKLAIEPADVYNLTLDSVTRTARNTKITITGKQNVLRTEWTRDFPGLNTLSTEEGATFDGRVPQVIVVPLPTRAFFLDIPLISDAHDNVAPIAYLAAGPYSDGLWPGATFVQSADGIDYETEIGSVPSTSAATFGTATDALPDALSSVWDRGNSVNVSVPLGELTSATEATCDANPRLNMALLGDELIQFATATLEADGTYTLTGLKRGRRGTEWATGSHVAGERFVMLDMAIIERMGASDIGDTLYIKGVTHGRSPDTALPITLAYEGNSHKPYAPAHVKAVKVTSGDWNLSCVRRSRIGGRWIGGSSTPLGESAESYKFRIYSGASVIRTITSTDGEAVYTAAMQTTDGGSVTVGNLDIGVLQVGDLMDGRETLASF